MAFPAVGAFDHHFNEIITDCLAFDNGTFQSSPASHFYAAIFQFNNGAGHSGGSDPAVRVNLSTGDFDIDGTGGTGGTYEFLNGFLFPTDADVLVYSGWRNWHQDKIGLFRREIPNAAYIRRVGDLGTWPANIGPWGFTQSLTYFTVGATKRRNAIADSSFAGTNDPFFVFLASKPRGVKGLYKGNVTFQETGDTVTDPGHQFLDGA
jgi:hypothetical protein